MKNATNFWSQCVVLQLLILSIKNIVVIET